MASRPKDIVSQIESDPRPDLLESLKKTELLDLGKHLDLDVKTSFRKEVIKDIIIEHFVDEGIMPEEVLKVKGVDPSMTIEIKKMQLEHDLKLRQLQTELERVKIEADLERAKLRVKTHVEGEINVSKYVRMVPKFDEKDVEAAVNIHQAANCL